MSRMMTDMAPKRQPHAKEIERRLGLRTDGAGGFFRKPAFRAVQPREAEN